MKLAKKIASIASAVAILASFAAMNVDASNTNRYSVSYETLTQTVEMADGTMVPAGSVAVTVEISNNTIFRGDVVVLSINDNHTILTNVDGAPLLSTGEAFENAMMVAVTSESKDTVSVASAVAGCTTTSGAMFTVYVEVSDDSDVDDFAEIVPCTDVSVMDSGDITLLSPNEWVNGRFRYKPGDCNNDYTVNAVDASYIMYALSDNNIQNVSNMQYTGFNVPYHRHTNLAANYFPNNAFIDCCDATWDGYIYWDDAEDILAFSAAEGLGIEYTCDACEFVGIPAFLDEYQSFY